MFLITPIKAFYKNTCEPFYEGKILPILYIIRKPFARLLEPTPRVLFNTRILEFALAAIYLIATTYMVARPGYWAGMGYVGGMNVLF